MIPMLLRAGKVKILSATAILVALTALADWSVGTNVSLAPLYILPMMVGALALRRIETAGMAIMCSSLRALFDTSGSTAEHALRFIFAATAYAISGLFVAELVRNHELEIRHLSSIEKEKDLRREAEGQLRILAESSPAAILTIDQNGVVLAANLAANRLFMIPKGETLQNRPIRDYLPVLADALLAEIPQASLRTAAQSQGTRQNGEIFLAHMWFSSYATPQGQRLAAIVVDSSEEMREREEQGLRQLMAGNRIMAVALSHEVRNFCGALSQLCGHLGQRHQLTLDPDLQAMASLVEGLGSLASFRLQSRSQEVLNPISLKEVLDNLRIVIEAEWREIDGSIRWNLSRNLPQVMAEPNGLMQAFLNLAQNSLRAVRSQRIHQLSITATQESSKVMIRFEDSGHGVSQPEKLFQPFQPGAFGTGLGLYVSRSIVRSYGGDLRYEPRDSGSCFAIELETAHLSV